MKLVSGPICKRLSQTGFEVSTHPPVGTLVVEDATLDRLNFSLNCLIGVVFRRCKIRFADFSDADLSYAVFEECDLYSSIFAGAILYTARFKDCDLTKADFQGAYLNGIRTTNIDITHTTFGEEFIVGANRKPCEVGGNYAHWCTVTTFERMIAPARVLEKMYGGIACVSSKIAISFNVDSASEDWRRWRRLSEVAKTVERLMIENGYRDKSLPIYFQGRYYFTRSIRNPLKRAIITVFVEWIWGYGIKLIRPVTAWFMLILLFALAYLTIPHIDASSGLIVSQLQKPIAWTSESNLLLSNLYESVFFSSQVSTLSVYGDTKPIGWARPLALAQQVVSVLGVGLGTAVLTRRIGNVG